MPTIARSDLKTPVRNNYYYNKLLDVDHFELETNYGNAKRWLLNRLVLGFGVVCGLDVIGCDDPHSIIVTPGVAIDRWGREIIVPQASAPVAIPPEFLPPPLAPGETAPAAAPPRQGRGHPPPATHRFADVHVLLCYQECKGSPEPAPGGDCAPSGPCVPGEIREQYRIEIREGAVPPVVPKCRVPDFVRDGQIDYPTLARFVTNHCHEAPKNPCIVLANVRVPAGEPCPCEPEHIDIAVRRVVYNNGLLFDLILGLADASSDESGE